jgi:thiamine transport system permease protein
LTAVKSTLYLLPTALLLVIGVIVPIFHMGFLAFSQLGDLNVLLQAEWLQDALKFTLWQAFFSSTISVAVAIPIALVLANRAWPFRRLLLILSALPFALPSVLVAFAFVLAYGRSGILGEISRLLFNHELNFLYSPYTVIAAHVFYNLPLSLLHLLNAIESVPQEHLRSAKILNLSPWAHWQLIYWPHIRTTVATLLLMVSILCLSSFAIVLMLGGGPQSTTLEVAIFQLLRFDANTSSAVLVAFFQLLLVFPAVFLYRKLSNSTPLRVPQTFSAPKRESFHSLPTKWKIPSAFLLITFSAQLILPLMGLLLDATKKIGASIHFLLESSVQTAILGSLSLATPAAFFCVFASWMFAKGIAYGNDKWPRLAGLAGDSIWPLMALSPTVLTLGWIVTLNAHDLDPFGNPYPTLLFVHTLLALPLCIRLLIPHAHQVHVRFERGAQILNLRGWKRLCHIEWPEMKRPLLAAFFLAFSFSLGDVSGVLMFGSGEFKTLPLFIFELMGAYRFGPAALASVFLALVCTGFFWISESNSRSLEKPK